MSNTLNYNAIANSHLQLIYPEACRAMGQKGHMLLLFIPLSIFIAPLSAFKHCHCLKEQERATTIAIVIVKRAISVLERSQNPKYKKYFVFWVHQ